MTGNDIPGFLFLFFKLMSLLGLALYAIFSAILVRQEQLMAHVLEEGFEPILKILVCLHFVAAIAVFLLALVLL